MKYNENVLYTGNRKMYKKNNPSYILWEQEQVNNIFKKGNIVGRNICSSIVSMLSVESVIQKKSMQLQSSVVT